MTKRYDLSGTGSSVEIGKGGPVISDNAGSIEFDGNRILGEAETSPVFMTGILGAVTLTINADPTKFDITLDNAIFVDHATGSLTPLIYTGPISATAVTSPFIGSAFSTFVGVNSSGTLVYSTSEFSYIERRTIAYVGVLVHTDNVNISSAIASPNQSQDNDQLLLDLVSVIGPVNVAGNDIEPVDATLAIKRTAGSSFGRGVAYETTPTTPNFDISPEASPLTFFTNYRDATTGSTIGVSSLVDPDHWDDGTGTLNALASNRVVVHRVTYFASDESVVLQYGQAEYSNMAAAISGYTTEVFEERNDLAAGIFRGWLFLKEGTTNLTTAFGNDSAKFIESTKFGSSGSAVGGSEFDTAANYSVTGDWTFNVNEPTSKFFTITDGAEFGVSVVPTEFNTGTISLASSNTNSLVIEDVFEGTSKISITSGPMTTEHQANYITTSTTQYNNDLMTITPSGEVSILGSGIENNALVTKSYVESLLTPDDFIRSMDNDLVTPMGASGGYISQLNATDYIVVDNDNLDTWLRTFRYDEITDTFVALDSLQINSGTTEVYDVAALTATTFAILNEDNNTGNDGLKHYTWTEGVGFVKDGATLYIPDIERIEALDSTTVVVSDGHTLATYSWNGSIWQLVGTPYVGTLFFGNEYDITALTSTTVMFGGFKPGTGSQLLRLTWNGSIWALDNTTTIQDDLLCSHAATLGPNKVMISGETGIAIFEYNAGWTLVSQPMRTDNAKDIDLVSSNGTFIASCAEGLTNDVGVLRGLSVGETYFKGVTKTAILNPTTDHEVASKWYVDNNGGGGGGGETNTASNLGAGTHGVFAQKNLVDLEFKELIAGTDITLTSTATGITINSTASGGGGGMDLTTDQTANGVKTFSDLRTSNKQIQLGQSTVPAGVGYEGVAIGYNSSATGYYAVSIGSGGCTANGNYSISIGRYCNDNGNYGNVLVGYQQASTGQYSVLFGKSNNTNGNYVTGIGSDCSLAGDNSVGLGVNASTTANSSVAIGHLPISKLRGVSIGHQAKGGNHTVAIGSYAGDVLKTGAISLNSSDGSPTIANNDISILTPNHNFECLATGVNYNGALIAPNGSQIDDFAASDSFVDTDWGRVKRSTGASAINMSIDASILPDGFTSTLIQEGTGVVTFQAFGGGTLKSVGSAFSTAGQYSTVNVFVSGTDLYLSGDLV